MMQKWLIIFILLCTPLEFSAAQEFNAGIVKGLWYDQELFFADEPIRMYVAVRNNTGADLKGAVEFFVNGERIERNFIDALNGRIVESWADWTPKYGTSTVSASLSRTEITSTASGTKSVTLRSTIAEDMIFVDLDTDKDDIGNAEDTDDDGDGVSDTEELEKGTDPLKYDEPEGEEDEANTDGEDESGGEAAALKTSGDSNEPQGLEQFLTDNRAGNTLSSVTNFINTSKDKLDEYREERRVSRNQSGQEETSGGEAAAPTTTSPTAGDSEEDEVGEVGEHDSATTSHIGEITRSTEATESNFGAFIKSIFGGIKALILFVYDALLFGLSKFLAHPILVQITLLLLILFLFLKLAMRLSNRNY